MKIEMGKDYRMVCGQEYRLLATNAEGIYPVVGLYRVPSMGGKDWHVCRHTLEGLSSQSRVMNLEEIKPLIKGEFWAAVYHDIDSSPKKVKRTRVGPHYPTRREAAENAGPQVKCIVHFEFNCEEGEGLEP